MPADSHSFIISTLAPVPHTASFLVLYSHKISLPLLKRNSRFFFFYPFGNAVDIPSVKQISKQHNPEAKS